MKVILEGEERVVNTIIRENRVRVSRGLVTFSPADSIPTPEGVTEEDVKSMVEAIERRDARIDELMNENDTLKAALEDKVRNADVPETPDTTGDGDMTDTGEGDNTDTKDAPEGDSKDVVETPDNKGRKTSKK